METLYPSSYISNSTWFVRDTHTREWTKEENKRFESALAIYDKDTPDRWAKVAAMIPGKTVWDVIKQYKELEQDVYKIEAGHVPIPVYLTSFTLELVGSSNYDGACRKTPLPIKGSEQERKKGVPWTEDEHRYRVFLALLHKGFLAMHDRRFLMGLEKYGKGDWRNISRNFVVTKNPTQVASHAQKYYLRLKSGGNKKRPSIHDITTVNLKGIAAASGDNNHPMFCESSMLPQQHQSTSTQNVMLNSNQLDDGKIMTFNTSHSFMSSTSDFISDSLKTSATDGNFVGNYMMPQDLMLQVYSSRNQTLQ